MAIRKVARMGHPVLRQKAKPVPQNKLNSPALKTLIDDMIETMHEYGGIGLAAPQIHESLQVAIIALPPELGQKEKSKKEEEPQDVLTIFINPVIQVLDPAPQGFWEGCLSVPGLRGFVERPRKIRVEYFDLKGKKQSLVAEGFTATVIQHELDHLEGVLYIEKMKDMKKLAFNEESEKFLLEEDEQHLAD